MTFHARTTCRSLIVLLAVALLSHAATPIRAQTDERCFPETGQCIGGRIREYWEQNGGLPVFGYPITPQQAERSDGQGQAYQTQWFERARFELHPENRSPYDVLLGRLGVDALARAGRDWRSFPQADPVAGGDAEGCRWFEETRHTVCGVFLEAFRAYGLSFPGVDGVSYEESLALFGLPVSQPMTETIEGRELTVQWFERARFELHPENQPPFDVLFGRLGAALRQGDGPWGRTALIGPEWLLESYGPSDAPERAVPDSAARLNFGGDGQVSGSTGCNQFGGSYEATEGRISFAPLAATLIVCVDERIARQEQAVLGALQGTVAYEATAERLRIVYDGGRQALVYSNGTREQVAFVKGTLTYRERIALPPDAVCTVQLEDRSRQDVPATLIVEQVIEPCGQVPVSFTLPYNPVAIDPRGTYGVRAQIRAGDQLLFATTQAYLVITNGNPTKVDLVLEQVNSPTIVE